MKKISAFFLALLPIFVVVLMFISGLIVKNITFVPVSSVELTETSVEQRKPDNNNPTHQLVANVLPLNATNPEVKFVSSNEEILKVDSYGKVTCVGFGDAYIYAISKENETLNASCKFHVWDNKIHDIVIENIAATSYMSVDQKLSMIIRPVPIEGAEQDPITFESNKPDIVEVLPNGELIAKQKNLDDQEPAKITLTPKSEFTKKEVDVRVGDGVNAIAFKEPNEIIIKEAEINLFDQLSTFPEKIDYFKSKPELFSFTSKNPDVATSDEKGNVTFKKADTATFEVMFLPSGASVTKKITSTYNCFSDVSFSRFQSTIDLHNLGADKHADKKDISLNVYPYSSNVTGLKITSSDEKVVSYDESYEDKGEKSKFLINGAGSAVLTATITLPDGSTKQDECDVIVKDTQTDSYVKKDTAVTFPGSTYYYLRDNIITDKLENKYHPIEWSIPSEEHRKIAEIDSGDQKDIEFIHFRQPGKVRVQGKLVGTTTEFSFDVECEKIVPKEITIGYGDELVLEAGKPYFAKYDKNYLHFQEDKVPNNFIQVRTEGNRYCIISKHGQYKSSTQKYELIDDTGETHNIVINVPEQPLEIKFNSSQSNTYITSKKNVSLQTDPMIGIIPSTARPIGDDPYKIEYSYEYSEDEVSVDKSDNITFKKEASIKVHGKLEDPDTKKQLTKDFVIKSTFGTLGKFALTDGEKIIQSGDTVSLLPDGSEKVLTLVSNLSEDLIERPQLDIKSVTDAHAVYYDDPVFDLTTKRLSFKLRANQDKIGLETLKISSAEKYFFYLTVASPTVVRGFDLYYHNEKLEKSDNAIITHTDNLQFFVAANPLQATESLKFNAKLIHPDEHEEPIIVTPGINKITLPKLTVENKDYKLVLTTEDGKITNTFKFKYNEDVDYLGIEEADEKNSIFIECGSTSKVLTLVTDGLVDDNFFDRNFQNGNFKFTLNNKTREKISRSGNKIVISEMPSPTQTPTYTNSCSLEIKESNVKKDYSLTREIVSRIVLPNHDNTDINDFKGLQRVHVFGNKSMYSAKEGMLDYYKLPITLYDYQGKPIEDTADKPLKEEAFNTLLHNTDTRATFKYHRMDDNNPKGFVEVHFSQDPNTVYTADEIYNDRFVDGVKDVKFVISDHITASGKMLKAFAQYEFVPVNGVNAYCEEVLDCKKTNNYNVVLQTNFGLPDKTIDNMPFTNVEAAEFHDIYGNGYTINFNARSEHNIGKMPSDFDIKISKMFNTTLQGSNKDVLQKSQSRIRSVPSSADGCFYEYNTITNVFHGVSFWAMGALSHEAHVRKNMFYDNKLVSLHVDGGDDPDDQVPNVYIENCVFFNCSAAAISLMKKGYIYFKGDISIYNFQNQQMLDLRGYPEWGADFRFLWDILIDDPTIVGANVIQKNAAGEKNVNSNMFTVGNGTDNVSFWDGQQYVRGKQGTPQTCPYLINFYNIDFIPIGLWATKAVAGAPNYYDEFDKDGKIRFDFMSKQVQKIVRVIPTMFLLRHSMYLR